MYIAVVDRHALAAIGLHRAESAVPAKSQDLRRAIQASLRVAPQAAAEGASMLRSMTVHDCRGERLH